MLLLLSQIVEMIEKEGPNIFVKRKLALNFLQLLVIPNQNAHVASCYQELTL